MRRLILASALLALVLVVSVGAAAADPPSPDNPAGRSNDILGVVPVHSFARGGHGGGGNNLSYHGGPVLRANRTVAIYWGSDFGSGYQSTINQYLGDVATASGRTDNVYSVETQYYDATGFIAYSSSFGGSLTDTGAPPNTCSDSVAATTSCVSDASIRAEVQARVSNPDPNTVYFVFTARNVGSCYSAGTCAFSYYCAYHSSFVGTNGRTYLYANQPYADTVPSACDVGLHPNGNDADATINVTSHEHREAVNDPFGNAWYDRQGYEGSDKCAWNFGSLLGNNYNQVINGHRYILQQEWSNAISGCALHG